MIEKSPAAGEVLQVKGQLLDLSIPKVMGIINVTPDSFYSASKYKEEKAVLDAVGQMLTEGAAIIDIGGMSSRPGAALIDEEEELRRSIPVIKAIVREYPQALISIDTVRARVALEAVENGAAMINDISAGLLDPEMYETVARLQVPYILMHMKGRPRDMQANPTYENLMDELYLFFEDRIEFAEKAGIPQDRIAFHYYPAGHMMYVEEGSLARLAEDLRRFIRAHTHPPQP